MPEAPLDPGLIAQVLEQASELLQVEESAQAEAWASGVLGLWREPGAEVDPFAADRQLAQALAEDPSVEARALAAALAAVAPSPSTAGFGTAAASMGDADGPDWVAALGSARPGNGWLIVADAGHRTAILEFESADGSHTMLVELVEEAMVDLRFGPPAEELLGALDEPGSVELRAQPVPAAELAVEVLEGWRRALDAAQPPSESWIMNRSLALRRLELLVGPEQVGALDWLPVEMEAPAAVQPGDAEADIAAREVLRAALGELGTTGPSEDLEAFAIRLRTRIDSGAWPAEAIAAGGRMAPELDGTDCVLAAAGSYAARRPLPMPEDEARAIAALEWADWLGAVIGLVRAGAGSEVTADALVDHVNRCPEVSTSIPRRDREFFARAFGLVIEAWRFCGFVDEQARLTEIGAWAIPRGLDRAWSSAG